MSVVVVNVDRLSDGLTLFDLGFLVPGRALLADECGCVGGSCCFCCFSDVTGALVGFGGGGGKLPPPLPRSIVPAPVDTGVGPVRDGDAAIDEWQDGTVGTEGGVTMMD